MASKVLYAPIVNSQAPAFQASKTCEIYFSLSKFNGTSDFTDVQISVMKQGNGMSVINPVNSNGRYRSNGKIIIGASYEKVGDNLYKVILSNQDIKNGWTVGWVYKIQIRLSGVKEPYAEADDDISRQEAWLNENSYDFSEWSTVCVTKAIGEIELEIGQPFNQESSNIDQIDEDANVSEEIAEIISLDKINTYYDSIIEFTGRMINVDPNDNEKLYSYQVELFSGFYNESNPDDYTLIEDSGEIQANHYQDCNEFYYFFKKEFKDGHQYSIRFTYTTINGYVGTWYNLFEISLAQDEEPPIQIKTAEDLTYVYQEHMHHQIPNPVSPTSAGSVANESNEEDEPAAAYNETFLTSVMKEEENGHIGLKLIPTEDIGTFSGNICIRRTDEKSNFEDQIDLKIIVVKQQLIETLPIIYDYTIESGVYYRYGVAIIDRTGNYSLINKTNPVMRDFQYSFLLGEGGKQLKLKFDNTMQSFKIQQLESKLEPIGSTYPTITRNAAIEYRMFPLAGLISFQMDDNKDFCTKSSVYGENDYLHAKDSDDPIYNYIQEKDFRAQVTKWLQDGKPKLFKSPTEGNIIVRLTDVNYTPNQTLDRMIYSFTSNANEIAEANIDNYKYYGFYEVGNQETDFSVYEVKIGQLQMDFTPTTNILEEIWKKYTSNGEDIAGYKKKIQKVFQIRITINDPPPRVQAGSGENSYTIGNPLRIIGSGVYNGDIIIYDGIYEFDSRVFFDSYKSQGLYLLGDAEGKINTINANIDFLYGISSEEYLGKKRKSLFSDHGIGQIFNIYKPNSLIYKDIYLKYYIDTDLKYSYLNRLWGIEIEANPGCKFSIIDESSANEEIHVIGVTGVLRLYDLSNIKNIRYLGRADIENDQNYETIMVTYYYSLLKGEYADEPD